MGILKNTRAEKSTHRAQNKTWTKQDFIDSISTLLQNDEVAV